MNIIVKVKNMKKKSGSRVGGVLRSIFNFRAWSDYERVKGFTEYLYSGFANLFIPQKHETGESFEEAMVRLNLSEADLLEKQTALFRLAWLMVFTALAIGGYVIYCLYWKAFMAAGVSSVVQLVALVLAFRYHFWYYQIKQRKLGCTFSEWLHNGLLGEQK